MVLMRKLAPFVILALLAFSVLPISVFGDNHDVEITSDGDPDVVITSDSDSDSNQVNFEFTLLQNPLQAAGIENIPQFVEAILNIALKIGVPLIALAIIYSGFLFVAAQGNPDKLKKARQAFLWTMVGAAILLAAVAIAQAIGGTIDQLRG
jgi:hypothetical protein